MKIRHWILTCVALYAGIVSAAEPAKVADDYIIGPGDELHVFVLDHPDYSLAVKVLPDGKISTPLNENMVAVGKPTAQLARDIEKVLSINLRSPVVNVIVTNALGALSKVQVFGEVKQETALPHREGLTVRDLVLAAGGLGDFASGNKAHIERDEGGKKVRIPVKLKDVMKGKARDVPLKPGDVLFVPESWL
jgi:polysaccharide biosynthesis/export protein